MKKAYFYIDDTIWLFRDLTRNRPKSIYDHPLMAVLKEAHDRYGMKVQMNVFLRTDFFYGNDEFCVFNAGFLLDTKGSSVSDYAHDVVHIADVLDFLRVFIDDSNVKSFLR